MRGSTRRRFLGAMIAASVVTSASVSAQQEDAGTAFSYPLGDSDLMVGDGFFIRHAFTAENTWYLPNFWHTGEDWYRIEGDTAGATVRAIADGDVVYSGGEYPGLVRIVKHAGELYSMYGHLKVDDAVRVGDRVVRGQAIGQVFRRSDAIPNHLHFEVRSFFQTTVVNGDAPRYDFACGPSCPPGPGYWPMDAPELPTNLGWLNPTHVIASRSTSGADAPGFVVVLGIPAQSTAVVWNGPGDVGTAEAVGELTLKPGTTYPFIDVSVGAEAPEVTSALAYRLWYRIAVDGREGWIKAAVADTFETGSDGQASTVRFNLLPRFRAAMGGSLGLANVRH